QGLEYIHPATRQKRRIDLERWILRRGPDEPDVAFLDMRQECILLGFIEAVDLVDKNHGPGAILPRPFGIGHHLLNLFDPGQHGGELDELRLGHVGDDLRQRGLAGSGRPPEDERARVIALDLDAQWLSWPDQMLLANVLVESSRAHPVGEWARGIGACSGIRNWLKQAHLPASSFSA